MTTPQNMSLIGNPNTSGAQYHTVQAPPQQDQAVADVALVLAAAASISAAAIGIATILGGEKISTEAIEAALTLGGRGSASTPNVHLKENGIRKAGKPLSAARKQEMYYRAAYIIAAARRIEQKLRAGNTIRVALADESLNYARHEDARRGRLDAVAKVQRNSILFGPLLGWYLNPVLNNEIECIHADGNNFYADEGTVIGWPGAVHPNCGCVSGPPHENGRMVNDAVASILRHGKIGRKVHLRAVS